jgi:hypothetical protein
MAKLFFCDFDNQLPPLIGYFAVYSAAAMPSALSSSAVPQIV